MKMSNESIERLDRIKRRYAGTAENSTVYRIDVQDVAWLINEVEAHERIVKELEAENGDFLRQISAANAEINRLEVLPSLSDAIKEVENVKLPPSRRFLVRFIEHVQGTNCAAWECQKCKAQWVSPANMECPDCHNNEDEPKVTEADAIYNQAIDDVVARLKSLSTQE